MITPLTVFGIAVVVRYDLPNSVMLMGYPEGNSGKLKPGFVVGVFPTSPSAPDQSAGGTTPSDFRKKSGNTN